MSKHKHFIEKMGLVIILVSLFMAQGSDGLLQISTTTYIMNTLFSIVVFLIGIYMFVFTDKFLDVHYKSMKKNANKKIRRR